MEIMLLGSALVMLVIIERIPALRFESAAIFRRFAGTDLIYLVTGGLALSTAARALAGRGAISLGVPSLAAMMPPIALFATSLLLYDLGAFVAHILLHRVDALWRLHKVHHSSQTLDWLATFRAHILEHALRHSLSPVLLILLGFPLTTVGLVAAMYAAWAAFNHANVKLRLRFLEPILITPRLHRLHHVPSSSTRNFGTIFSIWDRLCGTLLTASDAPLGPLGIPDERETYPQTWAAQLIEPFRRAPEVAVAMTGDGSGTRQVAIRA